MKLAELAGIWALMFFCCGNLVAKDTVKIGEGEEAGDVIPGEDEENVEPGAGEGEVENSFEPGKDTVDSSDHAEHTAVYGWKEWILFEGKKMPMRAKFDSGALTSSIHGEHIKAFEKDGQKWVRFTVLNPNAEEGKDDAAVYECRVTRVARIRNADGERSERQVVEMTFWIGGEKRRGEFTLNDRGDMLNPVLLGRSVVQTLGLIDVGRSYLMGTSPKSAPIKDKEVVTEDQKPEPAEVSQP